MKRRKLLKSEVVKLFNTTKETLRYYEKKGLLSPEIDDNNYRLYDYSELQKLREIFMLRDIGLPIEEMIKMQSDMDKDKYINLLSTHGERLKDKIMKLQSISNNIDQLLETLKSESDNISYLVRKEKKRYIYVFDHIDEEIIASPKSYYDFNRVFIEENAYSEKVLLLTFDYNSLKNEDFSNAKMCMELSKNDKMYKNKKHKNKIIELKEGKYLSIFYPYKEGETDKFNKFSNEIDNYLKRNSLIRVNDLVIEKEHPELSSFLDEGVVMFEIQIYVK